MYLVEAFLEKVIKRNEQKKVSTHPFVAILWKVGKKSEYPLYIIIAFQKKITSNNKEHWTLERKLPELFLQVILCQNLLFWHQLTHNMTTECSLNYKFNIQYVLENF